MDPITYMLQAMQSGTTNYANIEYYATCDGESPYAQDLSDAQTYVAIMNTNVQIAHAECPSNEYVDNMVEMMPLITSAFHNIVNNTECPPYQEQIQSVLQNGICHSGFLGFFTIWIAQYFEAFTLFVCTVASSVAYQWFQWNAVEMMETVANKDGTELAPSAPPDEEAPRRLG
jgi:hypothetical protein